MTSLLYYCQNIDFKAKGIRFVEKGISQITISLGQMGALFIGENKIYKASAVPVKVHSTVGAGDQSLGAFIYALDRFKDDKKALVFATVASGIKVTKKGFASLEEIENKMKEVL